MSDHSPATPFVAPELEEVARLFPNYTVHSLIACGGMGAVYEATQTSLDRRVAIKILPREFSADEAFREGFEAEAKAMAKLNHPNLIGVYDFGDVDGMLFIVMEFVAGNSLFASSDGNQIEPSAAISIITAVCSGLTDAHNNGILHRDIKPSNILLDHNANPKIGDFGLARALEREIQEGEQIFGTPGYTAPEVLEPPFTIDQRADIFSVGVMLHELLTGALPDADRRSASQICGCSFRLDPVIRKATHPDPNQRYKSCEEMAEALDKIAALKAAGGLVSQATAGSSALRTPGTYVAPKPVKSSSGFGFLVLLLVLAAGIAVYVMNRPPKTAPEPEETTENGPIVIEVDTSESSAVVSDTTPSTPTASGYNAQIIIDRLQSAINRDLTAARTTHLKDRNQNSVEYGEKLTALAESSDDPAAVEAASEVVARNEENDGKLTPNLPDALKALPGAEDLRTGHINTQRRVNKTYMQEIRESRGMYALELEHEIATNKETASPEQIAILQAELDRHNADKDHFEDNVMDVPEKLD